MVATDGHRLAWAQRKAPLKLAEADARAGAAQGDHRARAADRAGGSEESVTFQQGDGHLIFGIAGRTLASKQVEAQFPAFEKVIAVTATSG